MLWVWRLQAAGPGVPADGVLQIADSDLLTTTYVDADDGSGTSRVTFDTAIGDCAGPGHTWVAVSSITDVTATINWTTSEPSTGYVDWGLTPSLGNVVTSDTPLTSHTVPIGLFDAARLSLLKDTALFVNLGRGSVVAEDALARRLREGRLAGAVIDVTSKEPLPQEHEFWTCPHLILTQHTGGGTEDEMDRKIDVFTDNLARYRNGKPLVGIVDFEKGY